MQPPVSLQDYPGTSTLEERRATSRRRQSMVHVFDEAKTSTDPYRGFVVDRSLGGLCLAVPHEVQEETILRVRPVSAPASTPWVLVQVRNRRSKGGIWELGCEFLRTPSWEVLLLFG